jgi:hypothetical protein
MKKFFSLSLVIYLIFILLPFYSKAQCSIPNGDFNTWLDLSPSGWIAFSVSQIQGRSGPGFGIRLAASPGIPVPALLNAAFPCTSRSPFLNGYLKSNFQGSLQDTLIFYVFYKLQGSQNPGAVGTCLLTQTIANWTPFHVPINSVAPGPIDSVIVNIIKIGPGSSTVDFDDFTFSNTASGQTLGNCTVFTSAKNDIKTPTSDLMVYPNPANTELKIKGLNPETPFSVEITNISGQTLALSKPTFLEDTELVYPLKKIRPGMYFLTIRNPSGVWTKKIQVQ